MCYWLHRFDEQTISIIIRRPVLTSVWVTRILIYYIVTSKWKVSPFFTNSDSGYFSLFRRKTALPNIVRRGYKNMILFLYKKKKKWFLMKNNVSLVSSIYHKKERKEKYLQVMVMIYKNLSVKKKGWDLFNFFWRPINRL